MAFVNEDGECACEWSVHVCLWTVNITLQLYALNSVGGPSEEGASFFSKKDLGRCQTCKEWFAVFGGGFIFLLVSSLLKYQEQFYFNPLLLTASYCNPLSYIKCHFILLLLKGWSIIRHIYVTTGTSTELQGNSVSFMEPL